MLLKAPRWVLITEAAIVICAAAVMAYKAAMWVRPLGRIEQAQFLSKVNPEAKVREYYVQYPESYIRVSKESWRYVSTDRVAYHTFLLTNKATLSYENVRIELIYQSARGKVVHRETIVLPGTLEASRSKEISGLEVDHVPPDSDSVLIRVVGASVAGK